LFEYACSKGRHLISTWVLIRNDSRITGKLEVIGSSTGLVPTNALASSDGTIPRLWGSRLLGTAPVADPQIAKTLMVAKIRIPQPFRPSQVDAPHYFPAPLQIDEF
jgi:hypothetical protein